MDGKKPHQAWRLDVERLGGCSIGFLQAFNKFLIKGVQYEKLVDENRYRRRKPKEKKLAKANV
jgi:hypothetical protein